MSNPAEKSALVIAIDFVIGAVAGDVCLTFLLFRDYSTALMPDAHALAIGAVSCSLICGSLAALFRNDVWEGLDAWKILPPIEEKVPTRAKVVLWSLFACGLLVPLVLLIK